MFGGRLLVPCVLLGLFGCSAKGSPSDDIRTNLDSGDDADATTFDTSDAGADTIFVLDASDSISDTEFDPDSACATATEEAKTTILPVDIIWMVDNSGSMAPAVAEVTKGLNDFAAAIGSKSLDYHVVMISIRSKTSPITVSGSTRYPVCIPPPLAGDTDCGNGPRFFQSNVDIKSVQPLEQFLGTLAQTSGYKLGELRGGEPWDAFLRPAASKTIVVVTDDNSRLSATDFETFVGGVNPGSPTLTLPPGILDKSWKGLFDGYIFHGLYGWSSTTDPSVRCKYPDGTFPAASGDVYTTLVAKTGGVRAKICDGATAWKPFFDAVATAVIKGSKLSCELAIPVPSKGTVDPSLVNVVITTATGKKVIPKVADAGACGTGNGWYFDNDTAPTKVILCPAACKDAEAAVGAGKAGKIEVLFGCKTVFK